MNLNLINYSTTTAATTTTTNNNNNNNNNYNNNNNNKYAKLVHWKLCCKYDMSRGEKWYEHQPEGVVENEKCKMWWDMTIQCDHVIEARRPDIVVVEKEKLITRQSWWI